ncbi:MAG: transposase [Polyangiales bacterium]
MRSPAKAEASESEPRHRVTQGGRTGTVTVIQRFGGTLNLNVHFHTLAVDGVFVREPDGSLSFAAAKAPTDEEVEALLGVIGSRILRLLVRRGVSSNESDEGLDEQEAPPLHALYAASVRQRIAMGRRAGATVFRLGDAPTAKPRSSATTSKKVVASHNRTWAYCPRSPSGLEASDDRIRSALSAPFPALRDASTALRPPLFAGLLAHRDDDRTPIAPYEMVCRQRREPPRAVVVTTCRLRGGFRDGSPVAIDFHFQ